MGLNTKNALQYNTFTTTIAQMPSNLEVRELTEQEQENTLENKFTRGKLYVFYTILTELVFFIHIFTYFRGFRYINICLQSVVMCYSIDQNVLIFVLQLTIRIISPYFTLCIMFVNSMISYKNNQINNLNSFNFYYSI